MLHTLRFFFYSKCRLFYNIALFVSCIIRILHTGVLRFKCKIPAPKGDSSFASKTIQQSALKYKNCMIGAYRSGHILLRGTFIRCAI